MDGDKKTWTIVTFEVDSSVAAIPTTWLVGVNECVWPPYTSDKTTNAIRNHDMLNTCWPTYRIKQFRNATYDCYTIARLKAKKAEDTSELTSDGDEKRTRKVKRIYSSSDEDDGGSLELTILKTPPKMPKKKYSTAQSDLNMTRQSSLMSPLVQEKQDKETLPTSTQRNICQSCQEYGGYIKEILQQHFFMKRLLKDVMDDVKQLHTNFSNPAQPETNKVASVFTLFSFPLTSEEELTSFNDYLDVQNNFENAVNEMIQIGGKSNYEFVKRCLSLVLRNSLATKFSWLGRRDKKGFCGLKLAKLLIEAAIRASKAKDSKETESSISAWLRRSGDRLKQNREKTHNQ